MLVAHATRAAACLDLAQVPMGAGEQGDANRQCYPGSLHGPCLHTQVALFASISLFSCKKHSMKTRASKYVFLTLVSPFPRTNTLTLFNGGGGGVGGVGKPQPSWFPIRNLKASGGAERKMLLMPLLRKQPLDLKSWLDRRAPEEVHPESRVCTQWYCCCRSQG